MNYDAIATLNILSALVAGLPAEKRAAARAIAFACTKLLLDLDDKAFAALVVADVERLADTIDVQDAAGIVERRLEAFEAYAKKISPNDAFAYINTLWTQGVGRDGKPRTPLSQAQFGGSGIPQPTQGLAQFGL